MRPPLPAESSMEVKRGCWLDMEVLWRTGSISFVSLPGWSYTVEECSGGESEQGPCDCARG